MNPKVEVEIVPCHRDARGLVFEPGGPAMLAQQGNCHLTLTQPGCIRGNHFHRRGSEVTVVIGPALARYRDRDRIVDHVVEPGQVVRFLIPPGIGHAFQNTGTTPLILLGFNTEPHDPAQPDVVPDALIAP